MGFYLNPTNWSFQEAVNSEIYVDKTDEKNKPHSCVIEREEK